ncbi:hypothetical protein IHE44_0003157, partial [Lamprotornis superbus]
MERNEGSLTSTLRMLLFFSALMITLPVGLYFSSKAYVFEGSLGMSDRDSYFYAAIVAVVTVHVPGMRVRGSGAKANRTKAGDCGVAMLLEQHDKLEGRLCYLITLMGQGK